MGDTVLVDGKKRHRITPEEFIKLPKGTILGEDISYVERNAFLVLGPVRHGSKQILMADLSCDEISEFDRSYIESGNLFKETKTTKVAWAVRSGSKNIYASHVFCIYKELEGGWNLVAGCHELSHATLVGLRKEALEFWNDRHSTCFEYYYRDISDAEMRRHPHYSREALRIKLNRTSRRIINKLCNQLESKPKAKVAKKKVKAKAKVLHPARKRRTR